VGTDGASAPDGRRGTGTATLGKHLIPAVWYAARFKPRACDVVSGMRNGRQIGKHLRLRGGVPQWEDLLCEFWVPLAPRDLP
jgi:hypothetical protein